MGGRGRNRRFPLTEQVHVGLIPRSSEGLCSRIINGQVAQLVEQRTENPRVGGSIPPLATTQKNTGPSGPFSFESYR